MYIREAHAADGWWPQASGAAACNVKQPKNQEERFEVAQQCRQALKMSVPLLVDTMDDFVGQAYSGGPDRLYIIDRDGRVAFKGGRGPFGFRPLEMEQSLVMLLEEENAKKTSAFSPLQQQALERTPGRIPVLSNDAAWARLPGAPAQVETLPNWAKQLAGPLPQATAQMLKLDAQHRAGNNLDPKLRAKMRWIAADANGSAYAKAVAESDLKKAGATPEDFNGLGRDLGPLSEAEKAALTFAKKLTVEGASVTDDEVKTLIRLYGDKQVVGMVALIAHACFQDRVLIALDPPIEKEGPPRPVKARFPHKRTPPPSAPPMPPVAAGPMTTGPAGAATPPAAAAKPPAEPALGSTLAGADAEWKDKSFGDLLAGLNSQRQREGRIRVPDWSEVEDGPITQESWGVRLPRVLWNRVCYMHQPDLTDGWFDCVDAFRQESKMDRILSQDIFWVVTRSINCFY